MLKITVQTGDITTEAFDAVVVNLFEGVSVPSGATGAMDRALEGAISALIADGEVRGREGEATVLHTLGMVPTKRVVVAGLGRRERFGTDTVRTVSAVAARTLRRLNVKRAASIVHGAGIGGLDPASAAQALAEGAALGLYTFDRHKARKADDPALELEELVLLEQDPARAAALEEGVRRGLALADAVITARDLVNEPANIMSPIALAEAAERVAEEASLAYSVLEPWQMRELGMGSLLGVAQGSANEPRMIILEYFGDPEHPDNNIALVGKGITFDTGGISLKSASGMWEMKGDMAGGASVVGAMKAIAALAPRINVLGLVPAVENMPSGTAQRPGDVVRAMNGKTIEVDNTDAEGRLILADAMCYAVGEKHARRMVDIATLTGAIVVALGHVATGVMGTSQRLVDEVLDASKDTGEKMWQLPLFDEYKRQLRSDYADIKNVGGRPAGSITAALFMAEFTGAAEWAHLDIAGTFMADRVHGHTVKGASGVPTRTLVRLVERLAQGA
jgi:leucyl aminopeptidase